MTKPPAQAWNISLLLALLTVAGTIYTYGQRMGAQTNQIETLQAEVRALRLDLQEINRYLLTWAAAHDDRPR